MSAALNTTATEASNVAPVPPPRTKKRYKNIMSFLEARTYLADKKLKTKREYDAAYKSGKLDARLPSNPRITYQNDGWNGWTDFLGSGVKNGVGGWGKFLPFAEAKNLIADLGLRTKTDYTEGFKERALPDGLPSAPHIIYKSSGWTSWPAFLGVA